MQIMWNVMTPRWAVVRGVLAWSHFSMIRFGSLERDYSLSKGDMTLEKGLSLQHGKDVQLHNSLGLLTSSKQISYNFVISVISCNWKKTWKILSQQVLRKCVDSCAWFLNQNGLNSYLAIGFGGSQQSNLNSNYLSREWFNTRTTTCKVRRIWYCVTKPELTLLECLVSLVTSFRIQKQVVYL